MTERSFSAKRGVLRPVATSHTVMLRRRIWIGQTIGHTSAAQLRRVRTVIEKFADAVPIVQVLTDQVWEAWDADETDDQVAWLAWWLITLNLWQSDDFLLCLLDNNDKAKPA